MARPFEPAEQLVPEAVGGCRVRLAGVVDADPIGGIVVTQVALVDGRPERAVGHPLIDDADDVAVPEGPQVVEREARPEVVVGVDARHAAAGHAVRHADDVRVALGERIERRVATDHVADEDDPVGMRLLEHRAEDGRLRVGRQSR